MKILCLFACLILSFSSSAQETSDKQLLYILEDARQFFKETKGQDSLDIDSTRIYKSKITLAGTKDNTIDISEDGKTWAVYNAYISDSISLKGARKLTEHWRSIIENKMEGFLEDKTKRIIKNFMGKPVYGFTYSKQEGSTVYSISITYSQRSNGAYLIFLQLGRQY